MPTKEDLDSVYDLPTDENDDNYNTKKAILVWYCDYFLPAAAGLTHYGPTVRYYQRATRGTTIQGFPIAHVPLESEAFALFLFENCLPKWAHIVPKKADEGLDWTIPKYNKDDKTTHKHHLTVWSDGRSGQVEHGGWKDGALEAYGNYMQKISDFRKEDKLNDWKVHNLCLDFLREENDIVRLDASNKKKRLRNGKPVLAPIEAYELPEVEDTFSLGSEISSGEL